jgi:hypothetical protein
VSFRILKIGNLSIPVRSAIDAEQTYSAIGGETILRTISGAGIRQETWKRIRTTISGGGWVPPGLDAIDTTSPLFIACIAPRAVVADANLQAVLPAARRSDAGHEPWAFALMPNGELSASALVASGANAFTAAAVSRAVGYLVNYYPLLQCWVNRPTQSFAVSGANYSWELIAEEV